MTAYAKVIPAGKNWYFHMWKYRNLFHG